jgi:hypothetical protein
MTQITKQTATQVWVYSTRYDYDTEEVQGVYDSLEAAKAVADAHLDENGVLNSWIDNPDVSFQTHGNVRHLIEQHCVETLGPRNES